MSGRRIPLSEADIIETGRKLRQAALRLGRPRKPPPAARREYTHTTLFGVERTDPYEWLRAGNWRDVLRDASLLPDEIRSHLVSENAYCNRVLRPLKSMQRRLLAEMRGRIREDDAWPPEKDGAYAYQTRYRKGGEHPLIVRTPREGGPETVLFDGDAIARGKTYFSFGDFARSPDHSAIAWSHDADGSERHIIQVREVATAKDRFEVDNAASDIVWATHGRGFLYLRLDANQRASALFYHAVGTSQLEDRLILREDDPAFSIDIGESLDGLYAIITTSDLVSTETRLMPLAGLPEAEMRLVRPREPEIRYDIEHWQGEFFLLGNFGGAKDFKLLKGRFDEGEAQVDPADWAEVVPHRPGILIEEFAVTRTHLVRIEVENALPRVIIRDLASGQEHAIALDDPAYSIGFDEGAEFDTRSIRLAYETPAKPQEIYEFDLVSHQRTLLKRQELPSGHDPDAYEVLRFSAPALDGETIPVTLLQRRGQKRDGNGPLLLYAYGSYGYSTSAGFSATALSLVDRGMSLAIAHVRGGMEKGFAWYETGKLDRKHNTFDDYIAVANNLIRQGYAAKGRIVAEGRSAGGLLMGVIANRAPDLFAGIIANVPFVDVMNTMLDAELPLTPGEWQEWGNPAASESAFRDILSYSPYDNIASQPYPPILALGSTGDPRVTYWEPAKWIARLRAEGQGGPFLLRTNMSAGHFGASGRLESLEESALTCAFALAVTGLSPLPESEET